MACDDIPLGSVGGPLSLDGGRVEIVDSISVRE